MPVSRRTDDPTVLTSYPLAAGDEIIRTPAGGIRIHGSSMSAIEVIRFAGANRLCVDLDYIDDQGRRSTRTIEPYSFRRSQTGQVSLHAERTDGQGHRSYRVDRIQGASVTKTVFTPRHLIELTLAGPLAVPQTASRIAAASSWRNAVGGKRHAAAIGPVYVYRCSMCGKKFERKTRSATLRSHNSPQGWKCSGRHGIFEGQK